MPLKPEAFDYEGVFPGRARRGRESAAEIESWPRAGKLKHFDDAEYVPAPASAEQRKENGGPSFLSSAGNWLRRRGHSVSFALLFVFSIVLYLRPYELIPALSSLTSMAYYSDVVTLGVYFLTQISQIGRASCRECVWV